MDTKQAEAAFDGFEYFQEKEDDLHKSYNDRSYLSSEDISSGESRTGGHAHSATQTHACKHTYCTLMHGHTSFTFSH